MYKKLYAFFTICNASKKASNFLQFKGSWKTIFSITLALLLTSLAIIYLEMFYTIYDIIIYPAGFFKPWLFFMDFNQK